MISVAVVVRNGGTTIGKTLGSLLEGSLLPDEILIVDGLSHDNTLDIVREFQRKYKIIRIVDNPRRDIASGRNIALRESGGEILAYTDADCIVDKDWVLNIARRFAETPSLAGCGGRMLALPPRNWVEAVAGKIFLDEIMRYGEDSRYCDSLSVAGALITANSAYRREVLLSIGGFDQWFGNYGEDIDLYWRLIKAGYRLLYDPSLIVYHRFPNRVSTVLRKHFGFGIASSKLTKKHIGKARIDWFLYRAIVEDIVDLLRLRSPLETSLQLSQKLAHLAGKIYGSIKSGVVNI